MKRSPRHPGRSHHSGRGLRSEGRRPGHTPDPPPPPSAQADPAMPFIEGDQEETRLNRERYIWSEGSNSVPSVVSSSPSSGNLTYVQGGRGWGNQKVPLSRQAHAAS